MESSDYNEKMDGSDDVFCCRLPDVFCCLMCVSSLWSWIERLDCHDMPLEWVLVESSVLMGNG